MAEISYNSIFDGVSVTLSRAFPSAKIHGSAVEQDFECGDFVVLPIKPEHIGEMGVRAKRSLHFDIIYHTYSHGGCSECLRVADTVIGALGSIVTPQGDTVHAADFDFTVTDDVMHCTVSYPHFVHTPIESDAMESLKINQEVM